MDPNQYPRRRFRRVMLAYFSGACVLFSYLDNGDTSLQSLAPRHLDVVFLEIRSRGTPVPMIPRRPLRMVSSARPWIKKPTIPSGSKSLPVTRYRE